MEYGSRIMFLQDGKTVEGMLLTKEPRTITWPDGQEILSVAVKYRDEVLTVPVTMCWVFEKSPMGYNMEPMWQMLGVPATNNNPLSPPESNEVDVDVDAIVKEQVDKHLGPSGYTVTGMDVVLAAALSFIVATVAAYWVLHAF